MGRNTVGKMQLISRREKIHFAQVLGYDESWRDWWNTCFSCKPIGKRRVYDHVRLGYTLDEIMPHGSDFEYTIAHQAFDCRGWRSYSGKRHWNGEYISFAYHLPPWK